MKTDHAGGMYKRDVLRVRTFGPVSAHSRACECALSGLRVRALGAASSRSRAAKSALLHANCRVACGKCGLGAMNYEEF